METLKQTLIIPKNHKIHLTLPDNFPTGQVEVVIIFNKLVSSSVESNNLEILKLAGAFKNSPRFGGDPVLIQKAMRNEWKR